ncbi:hypothetical protein TNCV_937691 [Trichonephila clavipes]|nr:hypothetical protein TNCV_937691 [Trichonephila clavipes]
MNAGGVGELKKNYLESWASALRSDCSLFKETECTSLAAETLLYGFNDKQFVEKKILFQHLAVTIYLFYLYATSQYEGLFDTLVTFSPIHLGSSLRKSLARSTDKFNVGQLKLVSRTDCNIRPKAQFRYFLELNTGSRNLEKERKLCVSLFYLPVLL